jgi:3-oxoacyl-[acyl-carrier-protein] synthase III
MLQPSLCIEDIDVLAYTAVCRDVYEPSTASIVGKRLGVKSDAQVFDISNAYRAFRQ